MCPAPLIFNRVDLSSCRLLLLFIACYGKVICSAATIDDYYASKPQLGQFIIAPDSPYLLKSTYTVDHTIVTIYPTFRFDDNSTGWNNTQKYVPSKVVLPLPSCAFNRFSRLYVYPPECDNLLLYGYESIPPVPNDINLVNGPWGLLIVARSVPALDAGYPDNSKGTVTWLRPPGCPDWENFTLQLGVGPMQDVGDPMPTLYQDSGTGDTLNPVVVGLGCIAESRPYRSPIYNPQPIFVPVCRGILPYNTTNTSSIVETVYQNLFGQVRQPLNVPPGAVVYMVRFEDMFEDLRAFVNVRFEYPDGTEDAYTLYGGYNHIYYLISRGSMPAYVSACYYQPDCTPTVAWNEVELGFLPPCDCAPTSRNVVCNNASDSVDLGPHGRLDLPNFDASQPFVSNPTCAMSVNPPSEANPLVNIDFQVQALSSGGSGPLNYQWQLAGLPPSAGQIVGPNNVPTITVRVSALSTFSIVLVVWTANSIPQRCNRTVTVVANQPVACIIPSEVNGLVVGTSLGLDGACSKSLDGNPLTYRWSIIASPYPYTGGSVLPTTAPMTGFTCQDEGVYIVLLQVNNSFSSASTSAIIRCVTPSSDPSAPGTPATPSAPAIPNCSYNVPLPPFNIPLPPPTTNPPLAPIPIPPGSLPPPITPNPAGMPPSGAPLTSSQMSMMNIINGIALGLGIAFSIIALLILMHRLLRQNMSNRWEPQPLYAEEDKDA